MKKIQKDVQMAHLTQMIEKKEREREEQIVNTVIEGEQVRQHALEFADIENIKRAHKKE